GEARGDEHRLERGPADGRDADADGRGVLELTGGRAAVAARRVAVVALLGALDDAVAAGRGVAGDRVVDREHGARERRGEGKQRAARVHRPNVERGGRSFYRHRRLHVNVESCAPPWNGTAEPYIVPALRGPATVFTPEASSRPAARSS